MPESPATEKAFRWMVGILRSLEIPFQVSGGLAAKAYGSLRPLNDIDIDIPDDKLKDLYSHVKELVTYGPIRHKDEQWDLNVMTLRYLGQTIDVSGTGGQMYDERKGIWLKAEANLATSELAEIFGIVVPVMCREDIMRFKSLLPGKHQEEDIAAIRRSMS